MEHDTRVEETAILWDLDGTLVNLVISLDDIRQWKEELEGVFAPLGWTRGWSPLLPSLEAALEMAGGPVDRHEIYDIIDQRELDALQSVQVFDASLRTLCRLGDYGYPQAIITNNGPRACDEALKVLARHATVLGLELPKFLSVQTRSPLYRAKPAPDILQAALREMPPCRQVLVVGDQETDGQAGEALAALTGVETHWVRASPAEIRAPVSVGVRMLRHLNILV